MSTYRRSCTENSLRSRWDTRKHNYMDAVYGCCFFPPLVLIPGLFWVIDRQITKLRIEKVSGHELDDCWDDDRG
jgi:hypothetical protein